MDLNPTQKKKVNEFIYEVSMFIRTIEDREVKVKEIQKMLTNISRHHVMCLLQVRKIYEKKISIINTRVTVETANDWLSFIKSKQSMSLGNVIAIFYRDKKLPLEISKFLDNESLCHISLSNIKKDLQDLQKKFDVIETELCENQKTLIVLQRILLMMGAGNLDYIELAYPLQALRLNLAKQYYCMAENIGQVFIKNVTFNKNWKQELDNAAIDIENKLLYL